MISDFVWEQKGDGCCVFENGRWIESMKAKTPNKLLNNILEANGNTPLTKLNKIPHERKLKCNIYMKLEYFNASGSLEDRAAVRMIEVAEQNGLTKENIVLAPANGNIAIAIAVVCAVKGYKCVIVTSDRSTRDIHNILKALNAQVVCVSASKNDVPNSHYTYAKVLAEGIKNSYFLDETVSGANALAHYETTAAEIVYALDKKVDLIVVPIRTGAAFVGIAKYIEQHRLNTKVCAVCNHDSLFPYIPELCSRERLSTADISCASGIEFVCSKDAFLMTRRLIREEGLMVGPSSGAATLAALKLGDSLPQGSNVVVIAADGIRNYMNHFIDDEWLYKNKLLHNVDKKTIVPKEQFDPKVLVYDPTTLAGEWKRNETTKKWVICSKKFKPFRPTRPAVMENVLESISNTPLVKLQKIPLENGIKCNILKFDLMQPHKIDKKPLEVMESYTMPFPNCIEDDSDARVYCYRVRSILLGVECTELEDDRKSFII